MCLIPQNCTLEKDEKMVNFLLFIFYHSLKKRGNHVHQLEQAVSVNSVSGEVHTELG